MTPAEIVAQYQNLLIIQYKTLAKAVATIGALCTEVVADMIYTQVQNAYDLETATGVQLDLLGFYVGAFRTLAGFTPSGLDYFQFPSYADGPTGFFGFADYSDVTPPVPFWKLYSVVSTTYTLSDGQMSALIAYMIAVHASDHTNAAIDLILEEFFDGYVTLTDGGDMTLTYTHDQTNDPSLLFEIVKYLGILPQPSGVAITVLEV